MNKIISLTKFNFSYEERIYLNTNNIKYITSDKDNKYNYLQFESGYIHITESMEEVKKLLGSNFISFFNSYDLPCFINYDYITQVSCSVNNETLILMKDKYGIRVKESLEDVIKKPNKN